MLVRATLVSILNVLKNKNNPKLNIEIAEIVNIRKLYFDISPKIKQKKYRNQDGK
tara:strand:+ start:2235 stop:2399 length:165 start_codon:yes stop_codon:yes gene_type:complete